ncbi:MAG: NAD-dependent deacylase [bacterium]
MGHYEQAARILADTDKAIAFTGAGISAESGIPTFRDPGGLWDQFDPAEVGTVQGIMRMVEKKPQVLRDFLLNTIHIFETAKPNPAHYALAELEKMGILTTVISQNIDNLHTDAGNTNVYDVHGNLFRARCISCGRKYPLDKPELLRKARQTLENEGFDLQKVMAIMPKCDCGGMTRPDVVMFGEAVQMLHQSFKAASECEVMIVLGTSGVVYPAAAMPQQAHQAGAKIIEINPTDNSFSALTELYIKEPTGEAMPKIMEELHKIAG